jgi:hypothetical protein
MKRWWGEKIRSKAVTFLKWWLIRSSQQKFYAHFGARLPIIEAWIRGANWMASPWAGRIKNIRTSWECDPLRTCFYQHSSNVGLCCKIGLRRFECVESLSLQELAFITIHPMLACAVKQMIRWNQYCSIVNCREPLNYVAAQHWTSAQELHIILCCFLIFWYLSNTFFPCSSSMVSLTS